MKSSYQWHWVFFLHKRSPKTKGLGAQNCIRNRLGYFSCLWSKLVHDDKFSKKSLHRRLKYPDLFLMPFYAPGHLQPNIEDYLVIIVYLCLIFSFSKLNYQKVGNHEKNSETILKKKYGKKTSCSNTRIASWFRFPIPKNGFRYALTYFQFLPRP